MNPVLERINLTPKEDQVSSSIDPRGGSWSKDQGLREDKGGVKLATKREAVSEEERRLAREGVAEMVAPSGKRIRISGVIQRPVSAVPSYQSGGGAVGSNSGELVAPDPEGSVETQDLTGMCSLVEDWIDEIQQVQEEGWRVEDESDDALTGAWDDVHGGDLPLREVQAARKEEVSCMKSRGIWRIVPIEKCWKATGKPPVSVRWLDTVRGGLKGWRLGVGW